eukprot:45817-Amphidinium_carterae.1
MAPCFITLHFRLAAECKRPADSAMEEVLVDPAFKLLLLPLQIGQLVKRLASASGLADADETEAKSVSLESLSL